MTNPLRTQRERRQETRAKLIAGTIRAINEKGYAALRSTDITKRAGVTWGAVQHLFGSKDELLIQVAGAASESLLDMLERDVDFHRPPLDRLADIIDKTWEIYTSSAYIAMVEIIRGTRTNPKIHDKTVETQKSIINRIEERWVLLFGDTDLSPDRIREICTLVVLFLSGLAARRIFIFPENETRSHLKTIKEMAVREFSLELPSSG